MPRKMRQSGVDWIGEIPEGWQINRLKHIVTSLRKGNGITKEEVFADGDLPCIRYGEIYSKYGFSVDCCASRTRRSLMPDPVFVSSGDILFACTGELVEEIGKNVLYKGTEPCVAGGDIMVATHDQNPSFLNYYLNCRSSQFQKSRNKAKLKVVHIKTSDIENLIVLLPTLQEQERIANYLDDQCSVIESAVVQTKATIDDYKTLKKTLVFEAVTGKNLKGKKVSSGQDWLGDIPAAWDVRRIVNLYREVSERGDDSLPILSVSINTGVSDRELSDEEQERVFIRSEDKTKYKRVQPGDLTYNMMRAWQGAFGAVRVNGMVSPAYVVARPKVEMDSRYVEYLLRSPNATREMQRYSRGIADFRLRLYWPEFKNIRIPCPPLEEQKRIADMLDEKCGEIDAIIADKERLISDLEAYKKSLIFEVVTGKREVA